MKTFLGIDVGSLTCKFVLINEKNEIIFSSYFRTEGNPILAIQKGLKELENHIKNHNLNIEIAGVGTTGSARHLAGVITGADLIKNEITAHAKGTTHFIPDVRTIIEIGGQDSKIIILENGVAIDFAMNLLCVKGNTKVTCNPNYTSRPIKNIQIGQKILTHKGRFKPVEQVYERKFQGEMIRIEISNFKKIDVTYNHPIFAIKKDFKDKKPDFIPAENLREGDLVLCFEKEKSSFEPIKKIKRYKFDGIVYNLNVEDDHSYVANSFVISNCAAGTGSFLDAQAFRLDLPIEKFGELALRSKSPTTVSSRCTIFAESDMIHKQQIGHKVEDIVAGLCQGLARNFLANVAKGKNIQPPIVFLGGVSENVGMRWAFEKALDQKIIVPKYNTVLGAFGAALLVKELNLQKTKFLGFEISDKDIKCTSFICKGCPNQCEVIEARIEGKVIARWGDRCGKWSNLNP